MRRDDKEWVRQDLFCDAILIARAAVDLTSSVTYADPNSIQTLTQTIRRHCMQIMQTLEDNKKILEMRP